MPEYAARLQGKQREILTVRPGLTSPASIQYAREEELLSLVPDPQKHFDEVIWPDKTRMNLEYIKRRTFIGDIVLILRTVF
jgi:lipopolysaccharide/colanic/teichoic acid biosynthesis glycosyltransferase